MGVAPELVGQLATKTTLAHATLTKLGAKIDKNDPDYRIIRSIINDSIDILRKLQLEVNT